MRLLSELMRHCHTARFATATGAKVQSELKQAVLNLTYTIATGQTPHQSLERTFFQV